jgi:NADH-quinone oxidoreductase subunit C
VNVPISPTLAVTLSGLLGERVAAELDGDGTVCLDVPPAGWLPAATHLRDRVGLDFIDWLSAVDQPDADPPGLDVVLHIVDSRSSAGAPTPGAAAPSRLRRLLLRTRVPDADGRLASLTGVWPGVAWHERETHEMFGLDFDGFDDGSGNPLRPLLLPDGFEGTPLRKSFVLAARASKVWPGAKEPGESDAHAAPSRRKTLPPGVPDPGWAHDPDADFAPPSDVTGPAVESAAVDSSAGSGEKGHADV